MGNKKTLAVIILVAVIAIGAAVLFFMSKDVGDQKINNDKEKVVKQEKPANNNSIDEKTDFYEIKADYPNEPLDKNGVMKRFIDQEVALRKTQWSVGGAAYEDEKAVEAQFPDRPKMVFTYNVEYQVFKSEKMGTVSYVLVIGEYIGGANGNESVKAFTFDKNGQIDLSSILKIKGGESGMDAESIKNLKSLSEKIYQKAIADSEKFPDAQMVKDGLGLNKALKIDPSSLVALFENFALTDNGPIFYFDKGAITIRAAGVVNIGIDWSALDSIRK